MLWVCYRPSTSKTPVRHPCSYTGCGNIEALCLRTLHLDNLAIFRSLYSLGIVREEGGPPWYRQQTRGWLASLGPKACLEAGPVAVPVHGS